MYRNPANAPDPSRESPAFEGITRLRTNEPQGDPAGIDVAGTVEPNKISGTTEDLKQPKTRQTKQNALNIQTEYGIIQYHGTRKYTTHLVPTGKPSRQKDRPEGYRPMPTPRAWPDQSRQGITRFHMPKKAKPYYRKSRRPLRREQESQQTNPPQPALDDGTGPEDQHRLAKMPGDGGHHQPEGGRQVLDTLRTTCTTSKGQNSVNHTNHNNPCQRKG